MKSIPTPYIDTLTLFRRNFLATHAAERVRVAGLERAVALAESLPTANRLREKFGYTKLLFPFLKPRATPAPFVPEPHKPLFPFLQK